MRVFILFSQDDRSFFNKLYIAPWTRIVAYAVGLFIGFIVPNTGQKCHLNAPLKVAGNTLAIGASSFCIITPYFAAIVSEAWSRSVIIAVQTIYRPLWSIAIGWLIFLCSTKNGGIVEKIFSWPVSVPLAQLNYSVYLIHTMIIYITLYNSTQLIHFQPHILLNNFVSYTFFSYLAAIVVVLLFEAPFVVLEKKLFSRIE